MRGWAGASFVAALAGALAVPTVVPAVTSAAPPTASYAAAAATSDCATGPLVATRMARRNDPGACRLIGRRLGHGPLTTRIPKPGRGVIVEGLTTSGEWSLDVRTRQDGVVVVRTQSPTPVLSEGGLAPAHDTLAGAVPLGFPWSTSATTVDSTVDQDDANAAAACRTVGDYISAGNPDEGSVWYSVTSPTTATVILELATTATYPVQFYPPIEPRVDVAFFTRDANGGLVPADCEVFPYDTVRLDAGRTYYVRVISSYGHVDFTYVGRPPSASEIPANDAFAAAQPLGVDGTGQVDRFLHASLEVSEPVPTCGPTPYASVWYRVDPGRWDRLRLADDDDATVTLWSGSALGALTSLGCFTPPPVTGPGPTYVQPSPPRWVLTKPGPYYLQVATSSTDSTDQSHYLTLQNGEACMTCPPPCSVKDAKHYEKIYPRKPWEWTFNVGPGLEGLTKAQVLRAAKQGTRIITRSTNDCGLPDKVSAKTRYLGPSRRKAGQCDDRQDGRNVLAVRKGRDGDLLAVACSRLVTKGGIGKATITESDIELYAGWSWTVDPDGAGCIEQQDLVATLAHEVAHVFGIAHVEKDRAQNLTMAPYAAPACNGAGRTLGLGDVRSLRKLY